LGLNGSIAVVCLMEIARSLNSEDVKSCITAIKKKKRARNAGGIYQLLVEAVECLLDEENGRGHRHSKALQFDLLRADGCIVEYLQQAVNASRLRRRESN